LHGLHPLDLETRLARAVEGVQSSLQKRGATLIVERVADGNAYLRLQGATSGCQSSAQALLSQLEEDLANAVPDLDELHIEGDLPAPKTSFPVKFTPPRRRKAAQTEQGPTSNQEPDANQRLASSQELSAAQDLPALSDASQAGHNDLTKIVR
jgi:Fe-S cluster biogenesis protein NfuA